MNDELAVVYSTTHPADAEMVKLSLEHEGIQAFVEGENQGGLTGVLTVRVCVSQDDAARAEELVADLGRSPVSQEEWDEALSDAAASDEGGDA